MVFWFRSPVIVVTDPSFSLLYGVNRAKLKQTELSLLYYRRVISVQVTEAAGADVVAAAAEAASEKPFVVFFPSHFSAGARRYSGEKPDTPVVIIEGRHENPDRLRSADSAAKWPVYVHTDIEADMIKAGVIAAHLFSTHHVDGTQGEIQVLHDSSLTNAHRAAFKKGLESQGYTRNPVYLDASADYLVRASTVCVVIIGPAGKYFEHSTSIPTVLFTWIDPEMTPANVRVIFDDSPWAMAAKAPKILESGGGLFPSVLTAFLKRNGDEFAFFWDLQMKKDFIGKNEHDL